MQRQQLPFIIVIVIISPTTMAKKGKGNRARRNRAGGPTLASPQEEYGEVPEAALTP